MRRNFQSFTLQGRGGGRGLPALLKWSAQSGQANKQDVAFWGLKHFSHFSRDDNKVEERRDVC